MCSELRHPASNASSGSMCGESDYVKHFSWLSADVLAAVQVADNPSNPYGGGRGALDDGQASPRFWVPPSFAIAHHLIKALAQHGASWFGEGAGRQGQGMASSL